LKGFLKYYVKDALLLSLENIKLMMFPKTKSIIIFTMAKVGSLSVYFSLKKWTKNQSIFHIHSLDEKEVKEGNEKCFNNNIYPGSKSPVFLINKKIINREKSYKIISLYRDPLERNISAFFDVFELHTGKKPSDFNGDFEILKQLYHEKLTHVYPLNWFEKQFFEGTKINVYKEGFDKEKGYQTIIKNNVEVLLINSNVDNQKKEELIVDFCNLKDFKLENRNVSSEKEYADYYNEFKKKMRFSSEYLNQLYGSKYVQHFFTEEYIKNQIEKWCE